MIDKAQGSRSSGSKQQGKTINASHEEFESEKFHCSLIDCPGHEDYIKNMITGTAQADGAILVVSSAAGVQIQTEAHMILAKQIGVEHIVVFVNDKSEEGLDEDTKALVEMDVREKLVKYGYEKDGEETTPIIFASARKASEGDPEEEKKILHLIKTIDNHFPIPERDENKPFLM
jgi:elongation factor Tu